MKIPFYEQQTAFKAVAPTAQAFVNNKNIEDNSGKLLMQAGEQISKVGGQIEQNNISSEKIQAHSEIMKSLLAVNEASQAEAVKANGNGDYPQAISKMYDDVADAVSQNYKYKDTKEFIANQIETHKFQSVLQAQHLDYKAGLELDKQAIQETTDAMIKLATQDPSKINELAVSLEDVLNSNNRINKASIPSLIYDFKQKAELEAASYLADSNPRKFLETFGAKDNKEIISASLSDKGVDLSAFSDKELQAIEAIKPYVKNGKITNQSAVEEIVKNYSASTKEAFPTVDQLKLQKLTDHAQTRLKQEQAKAFHSFNDGARTDIAMFKNGDIPNQVKTYNDFAIVYPSAQEAKAAFDEYKSWQSFAYATKDLQGLTSQEMADKISKFKPTPDKPNTYEANLSQFHAMSSAANSILHERMQDPAGSMLKTNPQIALKYQQYQSNQTPQAAQDYFQSTIAEQQRLGIAKPQLFTAEMEARVNSAILSNPAKIGDTITSLSQQFGAYTPQAFKEILTKGKEKIPSELKTVMMFGATMNRDAANRLGALSGETWKSIEVQVPAADKKKITEDVNSNLSKFFNAINPTDIQYGVAASVQESIKKLSTQYKVSGFDNPVERATKEVLNGYDFSNFKNEQIIVPPTAKINPEVLYTGLKAISKTQYPSNMKMDSAFYQMSDIPENKQRLWNGVYFKTNAEMTGVNPYYNGKPIMATNGGILQYSWDEISNIAKRPESKTQFISGKDR